MSWGYSFYSKPTVHEQRAQAEKRIAKLRKKNPNLAPITIQGRKIAKNWWGMAWCENLERYADFANRIGRGRSYVCNGMVLDLQITEGRICAMVSGSKIYNVYISIDPLATSKWKQVSAECANRIDSIAALAAGSFPKELAEVFMRQGAGLFPTPKEIHLSCDCPDWAVMCKHVAAALYGAGARLDTDPLLFFTLRGIDPSELIKRSVEDKLGSMLKNASKRSKRAIGEKDAQRIFANVLES